MSSSLEAALSAVAKQFGSDSDDGKSSGGHALTVRQFLFELQVQPMFACGVSGLRGKDAWRGGRASDALVEALTAGYGCGSQDELESTIVQLLAQWTEGAAFNSVVSLPGIGEVPVYEGEQCGAQVQFLSRITIPGNFARCINVAENPSVSKFEALAGDRWGNEMTSDAFLTAAWQRLGGALNKAEPLRKAIEADPAGWKAALEGPSHVMVNGQGEWLPTESGSAALAKHNGVTGCRQLDRVIQQAITNQANAGVEVEYPASLRRVK
jgi:hypothetical protein